MVADYAKEQAWELSQFRMHAPRSIATIGTRGCAGLNILRLSAPEESLPKTAKREECNFYFFKLLRPLGTEFYLMAPAYWIGATANARSIL
jgi:hypothetical protein